MNAPTERLSTGADRLDAILGGGLLRDAVTLLIGVPGSGKTILAEQCAFTNAADDGFTAVYFSTISEPLEKMLRFGQRMSFFDTSAVGKRIFYRDLGAVLAADGLDGVVDAVRQCIRERTPSLLVIDSFKALRAYADDGTFRGFLHTLSRILSAFPVTSVWIGEYEPNEIATAPEFAVADSIVALGSAESGARSARWLQVLKLRGGSYLTGTHSYRISADGIDAFPRLADPGVATPYRLVPARHSSGVQALDDMLRDGYWPGASTLITGPTGIGKTLMGLHFAFSGARQSERSVIATLQENPTQLERICAGFGWSIENSNVSVMYRSPVDIYLDEWVYELLDLVEAEGATRVVIDSLGDLETISSDRIRFREYLYSLLHRLSRRGVGVMMTYEVPELYGVTRISQGGVSHLADNVVLLQYDERDAAVRRLLTVLKTRAGDHDPRVRAFRITAEGITLDDGEA